jgi:TolB-like protein
MHPVPRGLLAIALLLPVGGVVLPDALPAAKKTVAVLDFDNHSGESKYDPLGKGIAAMMISDLSAVEGIQLVEREHLQDLLEELELQQSEYFDPATAGKIGRFSGADYVVVGAISALDPNVRIDTRVLRVESGEIVKTALAQGREEKFFKLQKQLSDQLMNGLEVALSPEQAERLREQQERNRIEELETALKFSQAIWAFDNEDYVGAVEKMVPVVRAAPGSELVKLTYDHMKERAASAGRKKLQDKLRGIIRREE